MAISTVKGQFDTFQATILTDNGLISSIEAEIEANSVNTKDEKRDGHLRSADFFDAENHPRITFKSTTIEKTAANTYEVTGDLIMRGTSNPITFIAEVAEPIKDPWGMTRTAANITGKLNRKDWGLNWNMVLEFGGLMVSEEVIFDFDVEAVAQA